MSFTEVREVQCGYNNTGVRMRDEVRMHTIRLYLDRFTLAVKSTLSISLPSRVLALDKQWWRCLYQVNDEYYACKFLSPRCTSLPL